MVTGWRAGGDEWKGLRLLRSDDVFLLMLDVGCFDWINRAHCLILSWDKANDMVGVQEMDPFRKPSHKILMILLIAQTFFYRAPIN